MYNNDYNLDIYIYICVYIYIYIILISDYGIIMIIIVWEYFLLSEGPFCEKHSAIPSGHCHCPARFSEPRIEAVFTSVEGKATETDT